MAESSEIDQLTSKVTETNLKSEDLIDLVYFKLVKDETGIGELAIKDTECSTDDQEQCFLGEFSQVITDLEYWQEVCYTSMFLIYIF